MKMIDEKMKNMIKLKEFEEIMQNISLQATILKKTETFKYLPLVS